MADLTRSPSAGNLSLSTVVAQLTPLAADLALGEGVAAFSINDPRLVGGAFLPSTGRLTLSLSNPLFTPLTVAILAVGRVVGTLQGSGTSGIQPNAGALAAIGADASVKQVGLITVQVGSLALSGQTIAPSYSKIPGVGAMALAGGASSLTPAVGLAPKTGRLTMTLGTIIDDDATATLALTGQAPGVVTGRPTTGAGALTLSGQPAILSAGLGSAVIRLVTGSMFFGEGFIAAVSAADLALTGGAPASVQNNVVQAGQGALTLTGNAPQVPGPVMTPGRGILLALGAAPLIGHSMTPLTAALDLSGQRSQIAGFVSAQPATSALALIGVAPTVTRTGQVTIATLTGSIAFDASTPSLFLQALVAPNTGALLLAADPASIEGAKRTLGSGAMALAGATPSFTVTALWAPGTAALVLRSDNPSIGGRPPQGGIQIRARRQLRTFRVPDREEVLRP